MFNAHKMSLAVKVGLGLALAVPTVNAQTDDHGLVEEVMVTGSRIARDPLSTTGPITVVDAEAIGQSGVSSVDDLLVKMPAVGTNGLGKNDNNGGGGLAWVDLRNLGSSRTLVLVNGRRFVASSSGVASAVDLGNIPVAMIDRIEVLTDGASAVYGADAVAGVINIVMKKNFDGAEVAVKAGDSKQGGGATQDLSLTFGADEGAFSLIGNLSHSNRDELTDKDRSFMQFSSSYNPTTNFYDPNWGLISFAEDGSVQNWADIRPEGMWVAGASERTSLTLNGTYYVNEASEVYAETTYTRRESTQQMAGQPISSVVGFGSLKQPVANVSATQDAALQAQWLADGNTGNWKDNKTDLSLYARGPGFRISNQTSDTYRVLLGMKGEFDNGFGWDVYGSYGSNEIEDSMDNSINRAALENAIANGANLLGGWDQATRDAALYTSQESSSYEVSNFGAVINGELGELQGGEIGFAIGAEYRDESGHFQPDAIVLAGDSQSNYNEETTGSFQVTEAFAEVNLPVLAGVTGVEELSFDAAVRYSDFSTFGGANTYRVGTLYSPIEELSFRVSYSTSFRAPSIYEVYRGSSQSFSSVTDPCATPDAANYAQCVAEGAVGAQDSGQVPVNIGGNQNLKPEEATSLTAGFVWMPDYIEDFSLTVDYYSIEIDNAISAPDAERELERCYVDNIASACAGLNVVRDDQAAILNLNGQLRNVGSEKVQGVDFDITKGFGFDSGDLQVGVQGSYLLTYDVTDVEGNVQDYVGSIGTTGGIYTPWRGLVRTTWYSTSDWSVGASAQYIDGGMSDSDIQMSDVVYINLNASYMLTDSVELTAGADNVFDEMPEFTKTYGDGTGEINSSYDFLGTYFWAGVKASF